MKKILAVFILISSAIFTTSIAHADTFKEGQIAVKHSNGGWSYAFSLVNCGGNSYLNFHKDKRLNKFIQISNGGYLAKYNKRKYQLTFFTDGTIEKRNRSKTIWRYATAKEMTVKRIQFVDEAKAKCC